MLATPEITTTNVEEAAVIRLTVPRSEMKKVFGPAVGELMAALAAQGVKPRRRCLCAPSENEPGHL